MHALRPQGGRAALYLPLTPTLTLASTPDLSLALNLALYLNPKPNPKQVAAQSSTTHTSRAVRGGRRADRC